MFKKNFQNKYDKKKSSSLKIFSKAKVDYVRELEMAKRVQQGLLAVATPEIEGVKIFKRCLPAEVIGGDFYSFFVNDFVALEQNQALPGVVQYNDRRKSCLGIIIGDVAGHGISSALVMALASGLLSEISKSMKSPALVLREANTILGQYIKNSRITHVTAFYALLNLDSKRMIFGKAGHPPALLMRKDGVIEALEAKGVFLGLFDDEQYEEKEVRLSDGDRLFFYTDGITETMNLKDELFGQDRLTAIILANKNKPADELLEIIFDKVAKFAGSKIIRDDRSLVIVEV